MSSSIAARNRSNVLRLLQSLVNERDFTRPSTIDIIHPSFISNHAGKVTARSREEFLDSFKLVLTKFAPEMKLVVKRAVSDPEVGEVWVWSELSGLPGGVKKESVDIFKLEDDGRITEKWDVQEEIKE